MTSYDEDLTRNPFYKTLLGLHRDLLKKVSYEGWITCIPRVSTLPEDLNFNFVAEHILIPEKDSILATNLHGKRVKLELNFIELNDFKIRILFKEAFYLEGLKLKFNVYCIEEPLNSKGFHRRVFEISELRDCVDYLWNEGEGRGVLKRIKDECEDTKKELESCRGLEELKEKISILNERLIKTSEKDKTAGLNLRLSIETYVQHCLNDFILDEICVKTVEDDVSFNKIVRNLRNEVQMKHFGIKEKYFEVIPSARTELGKLNTHVTVLGKSNCIKNVFRILCKSKLNSGFGPKLITSDDLLELLSFLIIKTNVNNWMGNLIYLRSFGGCKKDETDFLLTSFEAAIEFIKVMHIEVVEEDNFFEMIRKGDASILGMLQENESDIDEMCHPLCSCDKCERVIRHNEHFNAKYVDRTGRNCLHVACLYGSSRLIDGFLAKRVDLEGVDYTGNKPLHYAAMKGNQNALLILLHASVEINCVNSDGNSALHLAAENGHENCVKALLYYSEHKGVLNLNGVNNFGETALHLGAKWGFYNIVKILLEYEIDRKIKNKRNQSAYDVGQNKIIKGLIGGDKWVVEKNNWVDTYGKVSSFGVKPNDVDGFKRTDLFIKAIENNDLPLSCFYVGITESVCHPLCDCCELASASKETLSLNVCDGRGFTGLHAASKFGRVEILKTLLNAGADINLRTYKSLSTPLHQAAQNRQLSSVELLLEFDADANAVDVRGNTPLHLAAQKNDLRIVTALLGRGADTDVPNALGETALGEARRRLHHTAVDLMEQNTPGSQITFLQ